ncbi:MAG: MmcQ/YjbR family DNA-binding protein [Candidatus Dormibacteraeota bacterium]|nr:MmcQ/YjbR family DNA-binding protein [Candidatus Dormibacteraeota bacterium]
MITIQEVRWIALALPEAVEQTHWGNPSFRIGGRIFATVPDDEHVNVMIDPFDAEAAVRAEPECCEELWWGKRLSGVRVTLPRASPTLVNALVQAAWRRKAPKRLLQTG